MLASKPQMLDFDLRLIPSCLGMKNLLVQCIKCLDETPLLYSRKEPRCQNGWDPLRGGRSKERQRAKMLPCNPRGCPNHRMYLQGVTRGLICRNTDKAIEGKGLKNIGGGHVSMTWGTRVGDWVWKIAVILLFVRGTKLRGNCIPYLTQKKYRTVQ